jgi:inosine-uridine nucleoside N-ribohydrolase
MPRKIIIDCDPGIDDAMAILAALRSPELEVVGLTTVFGNADVETCALNGLRLVELEGNDRIPVAKGCGQPLVVPMERVGTHVHGLDGMGNTNPPPPYGKLDSRHAAEFIIDMVRTYPGEITLVPIGPLTNIGLVLRLDPGIVPLVKEVVLMGGSIYAPGNISPVAEANVYHDPHAADLVYRAGWPVTMLGLDVTTKTVITPTFLERLYAANNPATQLLKRIQPCYQKFHDDVYGMQGAFHVHDPSVVAYMLQPELYRCQQMPVYVETEGRCLGQTIADGHKQWGERSLTNIPLEVDEPGVLELLFDLLTR